MENTYNMTVLFLDVGDFSRTIRGLRLKGCCVSEGAGVEGRENSRKEVTQMTYIYIYKYNKNSIDGYKFAKDGRLS